MCFVPTGGCPACHLLSPVQSLLNCWLTCSMGWRFNGDVPESSGEPLEGCEKSEYFYSSFPVFHLHYNFSLILRVNQYLSCAYMCAFKSAFIHCILQAPVGKEVDNYAHFVDVSNAGFYVHV